MKELTTFGSYAFGKESSRRHDSGSHPAAKRRCQQPTTDLDRIQWGLVLVACIGVDSLIFISMTAPSLALVESATFGFEGMETGTRFMVQP
jgi:hypothetical protein